MVRKIDLATFSVFFLYIFFVVPRNYSYEWSIFRSKTKVTNHPASDSQIMRNAITVEPREVKTTILTKPKPKQHNAKCRDPGAGLDCKNGFMQASVTGGNEGRN